MIALKIHHKTVYHFRQPVELWPHRLILAPRKPRPSLDVAYFGYHTGRRY